MQEKAHTPRTVGRLLMNIISEQDATHGWERNSSHDTEIVTYYLQIVT